MFKPRGLALLLVVPALALGACGGGDSDEDDIKGIINDVSDEPASICDHATKTVLQQVGGSVEACRKAAAGQKSNSDVKVNSVDVNGDKATAKIKSSGGERTIGLVKEDGEWKVSNVQ
jgi:hypothetical protein